MAYNAEHGIDPQTIRKAVTDILERLRGGAEQASRSRSDVRRGRGGRQRLQPRRRVAERDEGAPVDLAEMVAQLEAEMRAASDDLRFEEAAMLRDELIELRLAAGDGGSAAPTADVAP
jgi:excinuclease ABC subunit B